MSALVDKYQTLKDTISKMDLSEDEVVLLIGNLLIEHSSTKLAVLDNTMQEIAVLPDVFEDYSKLFIEHEYYPDSIAYSLAVIAHNLIAFSNEIKTLKMGVYGS